MKLIAIAIVLLAATSAVAVSQVVFSTDFESGLPVEFSAPGTGIEGMQGYAGLGPTGNQFGGSFLRFSSVTINDVSLTVSGLPPHDFLSVRFLLAIIDSWDGVELFQVSVDGNMLFSHWFQIATGDESSYAAPVGGLLSSGVDLGFTGGFYHGRDRAYDLAVEPAFDMIPHTASSVTITWTLNAVSGSAATHWQGGSDESWAIDNVEVEVFSTLPVRTSTWSGIKALYR
jgi:hypothetical protein